MSELPWLVAGIAAVGAAVLLRLVMTARAGRRRAEHEVLELQHRLERHQVDNERLRRGLGGIGEGVLLLDPERRILDFNAFVAEIAGLDERPGRGRPIHEVLLWGQLHTALNQLDASAAPPPEGIEFELNAAQGGDRNLVVRVRSIGALGFVIAIHDQSRLKQLESLRRDFVANVSHELKTPLAAIQGLVETLRDDPAMPEATRQRFLERISVQSQRLNTLVGDLLTLSRLDETEDGGERYQPCDVAVVIRETTADLLPLAERKGIALSRELPAGPHFVRAEREGLRQVVSNLVDNAIKYTPEGGRVTLELTATAEQIRFEVRDSGIGLAVEDQKRVFERFYRVDRARSRELGGTGLGLSIVKNIVRGFGGEVGVKSAVGRGSTFWVTLPRLPMDPAP